MCLPLLALLAAVIINFSSKPQRADRTKCLNPQRKGLYRFLAYVFSILKKDRHNPKDKEKLTEKPSTDIRYSRSDLFLIYLRLPLL